MEVTKMYGIITIGCPISNIVTRPSIAGEYTGINKQRTTCYRKYQAIEYPSGKKGPVFRKPTGFQKGNKRHLDNKKYSKYKEIIMATCMHYFLQ
jgi:hypothetical protein